MTHEALNLKKNLVFAHKIIAHLKMDDLTYTHLSTRKKNSEQNYSDDEYSFYLSAFGKCFENISENDLLEVSGKGELIGENKDKPFNSTGVIIHGSIYSKRKDINAVIHLHTNASIAVSALKCGFLPISQHALHFYDHISYHSYNSLTLSEEEQGKQLSFDLGTKNNVIFLENHGFITCGKTIHEALFYAYHLEKACQIQCMLSSASNSNLILPNEEVCKKAFLDLTSFEKDLGFRDWNAWKTKLNLI